MNFCEQCGNKLSPADNFCQNCGTVIGQSVMKQEVPEQETYQHFQPQQTSSKKKSHSVLFLIIGLVSFMMLAGGGIAGYFFLFSDSKTETVKKSDDNKNSDMKEKTLASTDEKKQSEIKQTETKKEGFQKRGKQAGDCGDYPELSERKFSPDELAGVSAKEKKYMKNDILMRHGYIFTDEDLLLHFALFSCYDPKHMNVNKYLTEIERHNINLLK